MNSKEQAVADKLLKGLEAADRETAVALATAYQLLCQGVLCRKQAEAVR